MVKTAPGAVDGEGNYVLMGNDDPTANWKNGRGKQDAGPEYITVFDGTTGAELKTMEPPTYDVQVPDKRNCSHRYFPLVKHNAH